MRNGEHYTTKCRKNSNDDEVMQYSEHKLNPRTRNYENSANITGKKEGPSITTNRIY